MKTIFTLIAVYVDYINRPEVTKYNIKSIQYLLFLALYNIHTNTRKYNGYRVDFDSQQSKEIGELFGLKDIVNTMDC